MKLTLFTILFLIGANTFAKSYLYEGVSASDGSQCEVSFNVDYGNSLSKLRLQGATDVSNSLEIEDRVEARIINEYTNEYFLINKTLFSNKFVGKKKLQKLGDYNKLRLDLEGDSLDTIESIQLVSRTGFLIYRLSKMTFKCIDLRSIK